MSLTSPKWDSRYPDRDRVRLEAECLAECFRDQQQSVREFVQDWHEAAGAK